MSEIIINTATVVADDGTEVTLRRQPDGTYAVGFEGGLFLAKDYDTAVTEAEAVAGEVAKVVPAIQAVEAAKAELDTYVEAKKAEFEDAIAIEVPVEVEPLPVEP